MLTQQQVIEGRRKLGIPDTGVNTIEPTGTALLAELRKSLPKERTGSEKVLDFTGGKEIAQGLGQALVMGKNAKELVKTQDDAINLQGQLLKKIKEKEDRGEDTSRLKSALDDISTEINVIANETEYVLNPNQLTPKQVVGDALQLATTAGGAKVAGAVAGKATQATGILPGLLQGAKTGAAGGAVLGGATGFSQGLQDDKTIGQSLKKAAGGAIGGAVLGGVLGGVTGSISGGIKKATLAKETRYLDAVTPKVENLTPTQYDQLLNQGKIKPKTATSSAKYVLSPDEIEIAEKYKGILSSKDPVKNFKSVADEIVSQDKKVGEFLNKNNGLFDDETLRKNILSKMDDLDDITVPQERLQKGKEQLVDNFIESLRGNDYKTLWNARKEFDKRIEKVFTGSPTLQNNMKREFRNAIQDFIAEGTPNTVYKDSMKEMSKLFKLKDIIAQKAGAERKLSGINKILKDNEGTLKLLGTLTVGGGLLGLGSAVANAASE